MRRLFTDGWNSFWHFFFGIVGVYSNLVTILFVMYQLKDPYEKNVVIDLTEFALGYLVSLMSFNGRLHYRKD